MAANIDVLNSRHEKSLGLLTSKFVSLLQAAPDGVLDLKSVSMTEATYALWVYHFQAWHLSAHVYIRLTAKSFFRIAPTYFYASCVSNGPSKLRGMTKVCVVHLIDFIEIKWGNSSRLKIVLISFTLSLLSHHLGSILDSMLPQSGMIQVYVIIGYRP